MSRAVTICTTRFNVQKSYVLPTQCIYVFCMDLRINSDYFPVQHLLIGFYNRDGVCLLRGANWVFKLSLQMVSQTEFLCSFNYTVVCLFSCDAI